MPSKLQPLAPGPWPSALEPGAMSPTVPSRNEDAQSQRPSRHTLRLELGLGLGLGLGLESGLGLGCGWGWDQGEGELRVKCEGEGDR